MARNKENLTKAKQAKNDEFYTRLEDINDELQHYKDFFKDKIVYCNCDDGNWSNFWRFFYANFEFFGLKKLIATSYHKDDTAFKYEYLGGYDRSDYVKNEYLEGVIKTPLTGNGDFKSEECLTLLDSADIVVTNPPFSLFREYISTLIEHEKKFLIIGSLNAITYKEVFPLIKDDKTWLGFNYVKEFMQPDGTFKKFGNILWYTNLEHSKRCHIEEYYTEYSEDKYSRYDNCDAIDIPRVKDIPCDWTDKMGVPITFLDKYNPTQFSIIKFRKGDDDKDLSINGECPYFRILIKWKPEAMPTINDGVILYGK